MKPSQGDRIIINGIPANYQWKDLYRGGGVIDTGFDGEVIRKNGNVTFWTCHNNPYKDKQFSCGGCGNSIPFSKLRYIETKPGTFWKFRDGIPVAGGAEYYEKMVNYFECEFKDLN